MAPSSRLAADDHRRRTGFAHGSLAGAAAASDGSPDTARQNTYDVRVRAAAGSLAILLAMAILAGSALGAALARTDVAAAARSDGDQDKVFDDLEHTLTLASRGEQIEVIVQTRDATSLIVAADIAHDVGGFRVGERFSIVDGFAATMTRAQVRALAADPRVAHVEENAVIRAPNDSAQASFGVPAARVDASVDGSTRTVAASLPT